MESVETVTEESEKTSRNGRQLELVEHLAELRTRLVRCVAYVGVGMAVGWIYYDFFFKFLSKPIKKYCKSFLLTGVAEGFTIKMQVSLLIGLILALPLVTLEAWRFIAPGLTAQERRAVRLVAPLSVILFASGVLLGYFIMPTGVKWLVGQNPPGATFMPSVAQSLLFILKMYLAFGVVFQMPVVLMFLAKVGIVSSGMLKSYWRQAVVAMGIVAAAITPSGDAFTMMMMTVPMVILYGLSIILVRMVEK